MFCFLPMFQFLGFLFKQFPFKKVWIYFYLIWFYKFWKGHLAWPGSCKYIHSHRITYKYENSFHFQKYLYILWSYQHGLSSQTLSNRMETKHLAENICEVICEVFTLLKNYCVNNDFFKFHAFTINLRVNLSCLLFIRGSAFHANNLIYQQRYSFCICLLLICSFHKDTALRFFRYTVVLLMKGIIVFKAMVDICVLNWRMNYDVSEGGTQSYKGRLQWWPFLPKPPVIYHCVNLLVSFSHQGLLGAQ